MTASARAAATSELAGEEQPAAAGNLAPVPSLGPRAARAALPPALYALLALALFRAAWAHPFTTAIGDGGDTFVNVWWLGWMAHAASHGLNPFVTNYMAYPTGLNLMWNTSYPLVGLLLTPVTLAAGPVFAFNLAMTLAVALSAWTAFMALKRISGSFPGALLGGLLYGFSPFMIAQSLGHTQLTLAFVPPLILLVLYELAVRDDRRLRLGALLGLLLAAQLLIGEEVLAITALAAALLAAAVAALHPERILDKVRGSWPAVAAAGLVFAVLAAYPLWVQFRGPERLHRPAHVANIYVSDVLSFFTPTAVQQFAPQPALDLTQQFTGNLSEWNSYVGIPLIVLLGVIAFRHRADPHVRTAASAAGVVAIWSLGSTLHIAGRDTGLPAFLPGLLFLVGWRSPLNRVLPVACVVGWAALWKLPVLDNLLPSRLMLVAFLFIGAALALFLAAETRRGKRAFILPVAAVAAALVVLVPTFAFPSAAASGPAFFRSAAVARIPEGSVALVVPVATHLESRPLMWQADAGMRYRMNGGYAIFPGPPPAGVSFDPPPSAVGQAIAAAAAGEDPLADPSERGAVTGELAAWHVRTVILGPMAGQDRVRAMLSALLGRQPEEVDGVWVWWDVA